jgi:hypothetical protein
MSMSRNMSAASRKTTVAVVLALGMSSLAACGQDSAGPEAGGATLEDLQGIEQQVGAIEDRVGALEEPDPGVGADAAVADDAIFTDPEPLIGQEVTVSGKVSEMATAASDMRSAFRIGGDSGEPVAVLSATPPAELDADDVVQVSGMVTRVQRDSFEEDFGVAADELFDDPDAFFEQAEGQAAISADRIEVLQEQAES